MQKEKFLKLFRSYRRYIGIVIFLATAVVFYWYVHSHPSSLKPLKQVPFPIILVILLLYGLFLLTNFFITIVTIRLCNKTYPLVPSLQLTIYSTLVNFFGPLQSGPGFRAIYLKSKLGIKIKDYTAATLLYYLCFATVSLAMMFTAVRPIISLLIIGPLALIGYYWLRSKSTSQKLSAILAILILTTVQLLLVSLIYYIELRSTGLRPSLSSTFAYTGSANLALFVSFTPGAIGIRESFIYFARSLHGISTDHILSASLLDRSVYILFLLILFVLSSSLHLKDRLSPKTQTVEK